MSPTCGLCRLPVLWISPLVDSNSSLLFFVFVHIHNVLSPSGAKYLHMIVKQLLSQQADPARDSHVQRWFGQVWDSTPHSESARSARNQLHSSCLIRYPFFAEALWESFVFLHKMSVPKRILSCKTISHRVFTEPLNRFPMV